MCGGQRGQKKLYIRFCFGFRNLIKFTGKVVLRVGSMDHDLLFSTSMDFNIHTIM